MAITTKDRRSRRTRGHLRTMRRVIPKERFGKDHWSVFAYLACCVTANQGVPDRDKMRADSTRHPGLVGRFARTMLGQSRAAQKKYPTILIGGAEEHDHDDWDCADDLDKAGLIKWGGTGMHPVFEITDDGWKLFRRLTEHKNHGGRFADFAPYAPAAPEATP